MVGVTSDGYRVEQILKVQDMHLPSACLRSSTAHWIADCATPTEVVQHIDHAEFVPCLSPACATHFIGTASDTMPTCQWPYRSRPCACFGPRQVSMPNPPWIVSSLRPPKVRSFVLGVANF